MISSKNTKEFFKNLKDLFNSVWETLQKPISSFWLALGLLFIFIVPFDGVTLSQWRFAENTTVNKVARYISDNGDFYKGCLLLVVTFFILGCLWKKKKWRILALAMILSCATAGLITLAIRITSGRPRPSLDVPDGLYGPRFTANRHSFMFFDYDYQAFPSGHATTAFATAVPVLMVEPAIGIPAVGAALSVSWARFQLKRHRLSDLYMGMLIGSLFGMAFGKAVKRISKT